MTNEEAIKILQSAIKKPNTKDGYLGQAIDMAIKALEQQQDKVIHNHPCEDCYYNDGDVHAECVVCDKPLEQQPCEYEPFTIAEVSPEMRKLMEEWQQPCEDCISLNKLDDIITKAIDDSENQTECQTLRWVLDVMSELPSVTPKFTDEEIQKMQELEQAQLEKAYELGKTESFEDWLSTFNTDSATECFTAVQELKRRLEGDDDRN